MTTFGELLVAKYKSVEYGYCVDHVLNLITKKAFDFGGSNLMKKCRSLVQNFTSSSQLNDLLLDAQTTAGVSCAVSVVQDVITRWWSTYAMLLRLWSLRTYLDGLERSKVIENNLKIVEWGKVEQVLEVLKPFQQVQQLLEGEHYVTISLYPALITLIRTKLQKQASSTALEDDVRQLAAELLVDFNQRWGDGSLNSEWGVVRGDKRRLEGVRYTAYVAALLDPRTKKGIMKTFGSEDMGKLSTYVQDRMKDVKVDWAPAAAAVGRATTGARTTLSLAQKELQEAMGGGGEQAEEEGDPVERDVKDELAGYLREEPMSLFDSNGKYADPLPWWEKKAKMYPRVHALAMEILQIEATSASSERTFSSAGLTIAKDRASLLPENAGMLVFLRGAWEAAEHFNDL
jgi:hypothetical protein